MANETTTTKTIETTISLAPSGVDNVEMYFGALELAFSNGETLTIRANDLSAQILGQCAMHGLKQKLVDAAAISRNPDTGRSATVADKYAAVREVYDRLLSGEWNKTRETGAGGSGGLLFRALCITYPAKTPEAIREYLAKRTAEEKTALRKKFAELIATLKAPADDGTDVDAMLDELDD